MGETTIHFAFKHYLRKYRSHVGMLTVKLKHKQEWITCFVKSLKIGKLRDELRCIVKNIGNFDYFHVIK